MGTAYAVVTKTQSLPIENFLSSRGNRAPLALQRLVIKGGNLYLALQELTRDKDLYQRPLWVTISVILPRLWLHTILPPWSSLIIKQLFHKGMSEDSPSSQQSGLANTITITITTAIITSATTNTIVFIIFSITLIL